MVFVVLYFRLSERQQSLTEHENVRGAQRFQTPSYILSPLDSGPQQSLERLISFSPFLPFKAVRRIPPATAVFLFLWRTMLAERKNIEDFWNFYFCDKTKNSLT